MLKNWRYGVLALLFAGPFLVYLGLGFLWMFERGWIWATVAGIVWIITGVAFSLLASRWTRGERTILPYIDEDAPHTFSPLDQKAWLLVQEEANASETLPADRLTEVDTYFETAKRLAGRVAVIYHPRSENPLDHVPVLEALTAFELAAEDLAALSRQVPGSDLITPGHLKTAVQAAGYLQKANDWYGYLLPLINPATGLPRLVSQNLMVRPAWRDMQQNMLRWFFRAFVNRLGVHLIELFSGRLVVGADRYRHLTRVRKPSQASESMGVETLLIDVAGSQYAEAERIIEAVAGVHAEDRSLLVARFEGQGIEASAARRLASSRWEVVPAYTAKADRESARDRSTRKRAVDHASEADVLILAIDDRSEGRSADVAFLNEWDAWYTAHPQFERPPVIVAVSNSDETRIAALRSALPSIVSQFLPVDLSAPPLDRILGIVQVLQGQLPNIERIATIRHLSEVATRSKASRLFNQLGTHGRRLWSGVMKTAKDETHAKR